MLWRRTIAVLALVSMLGILQACCICQHRPGPGRNGNGGSEPWLRTGVVKAERDGTVIGYYSSDPADPWTQNWILKAGVEMPIDVAVDGWVKLTFLDTTPISKDKLCNEYGPLLANPVYWTVHWDAYPGFSCVPEPQQ